MDDLNAKLKSEQAERAKLEKAERDRETQKLRDEGKLQEAHEREKADLEARIKELEDKNVNLTRDRDVRDVLSAYEFKNTKALHMATSDITAELVQSDDGTWAHKSGASIADFAKTYFENAPFVGWELKTLLLCIWCSLGV